MTAAGVTVVTWNLRLGGVDNPCLGGGGSTDDRRWQGQVDLLAGLDADIVALTEAQHWDIDDHQRLHATANALGLQPLLAPSRGHECHIAVLYRWPRVRCEAFSPDAACGRFHHTLARARLRVRDAGAPIDVLATHLDPYGPQSRLAEAGWLTEYAAPGRRSILLGDVNTVGADDPEPRWSGIAAHRQARLREVRADGTFGGVDRRAMRLLAAAGFTDTAAVPSPTFGYWGMGDSERRSDLILVSPDLAPAVLSGTTVDTPVARALSDHLPVVASFSTSGLAEPTLP